MSIGIDNFFAYARARYKIMLSREGVGHKPWTDDPILQQYRFCNVFREDDKTTRWIRERLTDASYGERLLPALLIARWFNRIETLELLLPPEDCHPPYFEHNMLFHWNSDEVRRRLTEVSPLVTGAYMVKTPAKMSKLEGVIWCIEQFLPHASHQAAILVQRGYRLEHATKSLMQFPYLGPFMAYEIVTDLRHTPLLSNAPDIMTWANPGPGAIRGIGRVMNDCPDTFRSNQKPLMLKHMQLLLESSRNTRHWPSRWPSWEMREVEHTLCEFDKYERARLGQGRPKQRYDGGA